MSTFYYGCTCGSVIRIRDPRMPWAVEAYLPFWTEEREQEPRVSKGKPALYR